MSSKIQTVGACVPTEVTLTNQVTATALAAFVPANGASIGTPYETDGPDGETITVQPVTMVGGVTDAWYMPIGDTEPVTIAGTGQQVSVWIRITEALVLAMDLNIKTQYRSPVDSLTAKELLEVGVWQRLSHDTVTVLTLASTYELAVKPKTDVGAFTFEIWQESWMLEDISTPWTGLHREVDIDTAIAVADVPLFDLAVWGDSLVQGIAAAGTAITTHYFGHAIAHGFGAKLGKEGGVGGETVAQILTRVTAASAAEKAMLSLFWFDTSETVSAATVVADVVAMADQLIAVGNTKYAFLNMHHRTDEVVGSGVYEKTERINAMLAAHPKIKNHLIDVETGLSAAGGGVSPTVGFADTVHPDNLGYATYIFPKIREYIIAKSWFTRQQYCNW